MSFAKQKLAEVLKANLLIFLHFDYARGRLFRLRFSRNYAKTDFRGAVLTEIFNRRTILLL